MGVGGRGAGSSPEPAHAPGGEPVFTYRDSIGLDAFDGSTARIFLCQSSIDKSG
jgi:hypothetical protein